ncbi:PqiC family protein [Frateuria aurantia]
MIRVSRLMGVFSTAVGTLGLAACASAPIHYYTLVPSAGAAQVAVTAPYAFELLPVELPADVDTPQLVVRDGTAGVQLMDNEHWIAPLADQVQQALSVDLSQDLSARDLTGLPQASQHVLRIKVSVRRFESMPGQSALLEAAWVVHPLWSDASHSLVCTSLIRVPVGPGYNALMLGHQQALAQLSRQIAGVAAPLASGATPACPAG